MSLLDKAIEKHNSKITYVDHEEAWTKLDFMLSIIFQTFLGLTLMMIGVNFNKSGAIVCGGIYSAIAVLWHIWHLMFY